MGLAGKVVAVTGVTTERGLGLSIVRIFAEQGARIVGNGRREERGRAVEQEIRAAGGEFTYVPGDVSRVEDCERLIHETMDRHGHLDVLVNNAAVVGERARGPSHEISEADWDNVLAINLKGAFFCCRYAIPVMQKQGGGAILNLASSVVTHEAPEWWTYRSYGAAKAGMVHMSEGMAEEYRDDGIRVHPIIIMGVYGETALAVHHVIAATLPAEQRQSLFETYEQRARSADIAARELAAIAGGDRTVRSGEAIRV